MSKNGGVWGFFVYTLTIPRHFFMKGIAELLSILQRHLWQQCRVEKKIKSIKTRYISGNKNKDENK